MVGSKTPNVLSAISRARQKRVRSSIRTAITLATDILMNHTMFDHIVGNQLYNVGRAERIRGVVDFSRGRPHRQTRRRSENGAGHRRIHHESSSPGR